MGFSSMDELIQKITVDGQMLRRDWNKNFLPTTAAAAGEWHCLVNGAGFPTAASIYNTGTNLAFQATNDSTTNAGGIDHGGNVSPATKHIIGASVGSAATTSCPAVLMLVDLLGFYRITSVTTTGAQTLNNTVTLPRYTDGKGVMAFAWNTTTTAMGAATPTITLNYTNSDGTAGRTTPAVLPTCKTAAANGLILYSGTGSGKYNPFIPLAQGDKGIRSVQSLALSVSYVSGEFSLGLCKPIFTLPIPAIGVFTERDFVNSMPSLPKIEDGANLVWLLYSGVNTPVATSYMGHLDIGWN